ncbi:hypothetical protein KVR01_011398 [Diaporthe batatas]|uniref:uncharacterized protein n=1 Tax=Diaporthe batatas TaxID=748121 RepID=UPI001D03E6BB|nr:uncharacterized protein KVR01_011398 [Diaporthe batatas]KAG8158955.1 hypothetical protein KVR01_011398 [Diaporthe batatas]
MATSTSMATSTCGLPPSSQQSNSDLSEPPDFTEEEITSFAATMAPHTRSRSTRSRSQSESKDDVSGDGQTQTNGDSVPTHNQTGNNESSVQDDEIVAEICVATRSSRRRVPTKRAKVTFLEPETPATKRPKTSAKRWTAEYVTQSKQSPLVNKDLRALLLHPQAWDVLSDEDKKEILDLFPDTRHILNPNTPEARPNVMSLQNDDNFRHDTEEYVANLKAGIHDPAWLQDAWAAHEARAAGQFDEYYIRKLEVVWNTKIPDEMKPEHLRSVPPAEPQEDAKGEPQEEGSSSPDPLAEDTKAPIATQEDCIQVSVDAKESTGPANVIASEAVEGDTKTTSDDAVQDAVMASSEDGSTASVTGGLGKVTVVNEHENAEENPGHKDSSAGAD